MTRTMFDGVTASKLPSNAQIVAGYLTGPYAWSANDWARFPNAVKVGIATQAQFNTGQVLDVETGDATPAQAPVWVSNRRNAGVDPTVYCNASTWPSVKSAFQAAHVPEPHYWIAKYDQDPTIPVGAVAKQHTNTSGWDQSSVVDYWPGVDPENGPPEMEITDKLAYPDKTTKTAQDTWVDTHIWASQALDRIASLDAKVSALQTGGVDVNALAAQVAAAVIAHLSVQITSK